MNSVKLQDERLIFRNLLFFYTLIMNYQKEKAKKKILFTITLKRIKYLGISLSKEVKHIFSESYKTMMKEFENDTKTCKDIPHSWIQRINIF